jgi:hypothetical protein
MFARSAWFHLTCGFVWWGGCRDVSATLGLQTYPPRHEYLYTGIESQERSIGEMRWHPLTARYNIGMPHNPHRRSAPKFITIMQADREALEQRVRRLQKELWNQWEYNHSEHCGKQLPHSSACYWPMPDELIGYVEDDLGFGLIRIEIIDRSPVFRADVSVSSCLAYKDSEPSVRG